MAKQLPDYLKLHREEPVREAPQPPASIADVCRAFARATGWVLNYDAAVDSPATAMLTLSPQARGDRETTPRATRADVEPLAIALATLVGELQTTRAALAAREADLAAGVPVTQRDDEEPHLAARLTAALASATQAIECQAAALYMLDEATSELKLRSAVGLPADRLLAPPRPLRGAMADLEALLGHAVALEDVRLLPHWRCPEDFPSALCVPVSSPSNPLGTLWLFSATRRDFTPTQTNLAEVVAGRIATDLEREVLLTAGAKSQQLDRQMHEARIWQCERLPSLAPLLDDWDVAGAAAGKNVLASEFYDWSVLPDGNLSVAVGGVHARAVTAGLSTAALQSAVKAHSGYRHDARQMLARVNDTLWTSSPGGQYAWLGYGVIAPESGSLVWSSAGELAAVLAHAEGHVRLSRSIPCLGSDAELPLVQLQHDIPPGGILLLASAGALAAPRLGERPWDEAALAEFLARHLHLPAQDLIARLSTLLGGGDKVERTLLAVKRLR